MENLILRVFLRGNHLTVHCFQTLLFLVITVSQSHFTLFFYRQFFEKMEEIDIECSDGIDDESVNEENSKFPWYSIKIFAMFVFSAVLKNSLPGPLDNICGKCSICSSEISGRRTANSNFTRYFVCIFSPCLWCWTYSDIFSLVFLFENWNIRKNIKYI